MGIWRLFPILRQEKRHKGRILVKKSWGWGVGVRNHRWPGSCAHVWSSNGSLKWFQQSCAQIRLRGPNNNKLNFLWPNMPHLGPLFTPKSPAKEFMRSLFCVLSHDMRHINFSRGDHKVGVLGVGCKKFMLRKFMCFCCPFVWRGRKGWGGIL